jgi:hypothetical protein
MSRLRRAGLACERVPVALGRAAALLADRIWYSHPGFLMTAYLALSAVARLTAHSAGRTSQQAGLGVAAWVTVIWCWRVGRGGHVSRTLLLVTTGVAIGAAVVHLATWWDFQDAALLLIGGAQLAILLSPAAYLATRRDMAWQFRAAGGRWLVPVAGGSRHDPWTEPARTALTLRLRPPWWLLPAALSAGLGVTLAGLLTAHYAVLPHCHPPAGALATSCSGLGRGYPLPVSASIAPRVLAPWAAFGRDYLQWAAASLAVLQGLRLWWTSRPADLPAPQAAASLRPAA